MQLFFTPRYRSQKIMAITISPFQWKGWRPDSECGRVSEKDLTIEGFEEYRGHLDKMLVYATNMLKMLFSLLPDCHELAYETIQMDDKVDKWDKKMENVLLKHLKIKCSAVSHLNIIYYFYFV